MFSPIKTLFMYFPLTFFLRLFFLLAIDVVTVLLVYKRYKKNKIDKYRAFAVILLAAYITIVLFFTALGRRSLDYYRFGIDAVSYYTKFFDGSGSINIFEMVLNILIFVPIGILSCFTFEKLKVLWASVIGLCTSLLIELLQFLLRSGFVSLTDLIHNTLGALLGGLLTIIIISVVNNISKRQNQG